MNVARAGELLPRAGCGVLRCGCRGSVAALGVSEWVLQELALGSRAVASTQCRWHRHI